MSNLAVWSRPAWSTDRWLRDFFGPAAAVAWNTPASSGFNPAAEIVKDGDDAVVRVELPGVDVDKDVSVEVDPSHGVSRLVIHGEHRDEHVDDAAAGARRPLREIRYGSFRRSFQLPAHVTSEPAGCRATRRIRRGRCGSGGFAAAVIYATRSAQSPDCPADASRTARSHAAPACFDDLSWPFAP
jgi:HSP20 family protein